MTRSYPQRTIDRGVAQVYNRNMKVTTCQICARNIKANTGKIAHHGYQRPYKQGWQTGSCDGAKFLPYEESCDRLPYVIEKIDTFLFNQSRRLKDFMTDPPATLTESRMWSRNSEPKVFEKPADFDPKKNEDSYESRMPHTYQNEYRSHKYNIEMSIKQAKRDLEFLRKRLTDWKPQNVS